MSSLIQLHVYELVAMMCLMLLVGSVFIYKKSCTCTYMKLRRLSHQCYGVWTAS